MADEQEKSEKRKEQEEIVRKFRLIDDTFMSKVFEDKACAELLLRVILGRDDLVVIRVASQFELKNLQGRSARLDIYAVDAQNKLYDIEVQRDDAGAAPKRARYNSALMDANILMTGEDFDKLPESYVIFITEHDVLKGGMPLYTISRTIAELGGKQFEDHSHIIYVNGENRDSTALGNLMHDFFTSDPQKMSYNLLKNRAKYFKESKEGVDTMCQLMEDYGDKRAKERSVDIAIKLWNSGIKDFQQIADLTELPLEEVKKLFDGQTA